MAQKNQASVFTDPTILFVSLCITIMVGKKLAIGDIDMITTGFFINPYVIASFVIGVLVYLWARSGKQVELSVVDQWSANW